MCKETIENFINTLDKLNDKEFLINTIIYSVAPTLAKKKPSSLINFHDKHKRNLYKLWQQYKDTIYQELNLKFYELKKTENCVIVLFYDENGLNEIFENIRTVKFLCKFGYKKEMVLSEKLNLLKQRYEFVCPHEMGVFLGYTLEDVIDFMECPNKKCLLCGYWKVYSNPKQAEKIFEKYDEIKTRVIKFMTSGINHQVIINKI